MRKNRKLSPKSCKILSILLEYIGNEVRKWERHIKWNDGSAFAWSSYWQSPGCVLNVSGQILILACLFLQPQMFFAHFRPKALSRICVPRISWEIPCCAVLQKYYAGSYPVRRTGSFPRYVLWSGLPQHFVACQTRSFFGKPVLLQAVLSHMVLLSLHIYIIKTDQKADLFIFHGTTGILCYHLYQTHRQKEDYFIDRLLSGEKRFVSVWNFKYEI